MTSILEALIDEIQASSLTRYRIAQESGVAPSQLSRLVNGQSGMSIGSIEAIAEVLGLELVLRRKAATKRRKR
ncbi:helix-turn-helix protein [Planctomycetes bacterium Poly30]|uniref:Helix-turn-helix protein n=1 Tax=Saltatorellus ferox TaxID=2528018 RepID=A0A518ENF5_9BACT|nr:helix-turn-helix protein [Planctomycetes bacterium Poly30]